MRLLLLGAIAGSMSWALACSSSTTNEGGTGGSGGTSSGGAAGASTGATSGTGGAGTGGTSVGGAAGSDGGQTDAGPLCPHADMVAVGSAFCIDETEVTTGKYAAFLTALSATDAGPSNITGLGACDNVTDYAPVGSVSSGCPQPPYQSDVDLPVRCVDWCSAYAYCKWAGKRLCGQIPNDAADPGESAVKGKNQWYTACIGSGQTEDTYFYGPDFNEELCQTAASATTGVVKVGTKLACKSHYFTGLVDMTGNVAEWEDSCDSQTSQTALCLARGGSYLDSQAPELACATASKLGRGTHEPDLGFRCCWDPSVK